MNLRNIFKKYQNLFFYVSISILILIGFLLRIKPIFIRPITFDEAFTLLYLIEKPDVYSMILADLSVPPLQYLLVKLIASFSMNIIYPRIVSVIFSIMTLAIVVVWLKKISKLLAILVIFFLSFSAFQIFYAGEAYVYSQLFLLGVISLYSLYCALYGADANGKKLKIYLAIYVLSSLAAFFTHYSFVWTILAELAIIFGEFFYAKFSKKKFNFLIIKFTLIFILVLMCYLPIFLNIFSGSMGNLAWMAKPTLFSFGYVARALFGLMNFDLNSNLINRGTILASITTLLFIFLCTYFVVNKKSTFFNKTEKKLVSFNLLVFVFNLFIPLIFSFFLSSSIYGERTLIVSSLSVTILISIFLVKLIEINVLTFPFVVIFCFLIFSQNVSLNQTQLKILHRSDILKDYADFFRKKLDEGDVRNFVFLDFSKERDDSNYFVDDIRKNLIFDYYWFGYDGSEPLPKYNLINKDKLELYRDKPFWGIVIIGAKNVYEQMLDVCSNITVSYSFFGWEPVYLFRCN